MALLELSRQHGEGGRRGGTELLNILIVEDEPLLAETLKRLVELNPLFEVTGIANDLSSALRAVEPEMLHLARSMGAGERKIFLKIRFPSALPHLFSGLKVASTLAVIGAIIGEFVGSNRGLGYLILIANNNLNTPLALAAIAVVSLFGLLLYAAIVLIERVSLPWKPAELGLDESRRPRTIYSQVRDVVNRHHTAHQLTTYLGDLLWDDLEEELGVLLVERGQRFQGLTPDGERVQDSA